MEIQKYQANNIETNETLIGYIIETREYLGNGSYGAGKNYVIVVNEFSMPNGKYGTYAVKADSIEKIPN